MPQFDVMIGSGGVEQYFADTKAGAYKQAVKRHCKEGDVSFMKMTEGVITKEVLPKFKEFNFPRGEEPRIAKTIAFFYIANEDPDIWDVSISDFAEEGYMDDFDSIDAFLDKFFVKNKTKKIKEFKKNLFTMMRSAVFYLRFLNDPQVLFCNMDDITEAVVDFVNGETNGGETVGGDIWVNEDLGSLKLLKEKNEKLLPILTYDRKKIAADEEYKNKFLNIFQTMAWGLFSKTEETKERWEEFNNANKDEDEEEEDEDDDIAERLEDFPFKGKDYVIDPITKAVFEEDEDGDYVEVGFLKEEDGKKFIASRLDGSPIEEEDDEFTSEKVSKLLERITELNDFYENERGLRAEEEERADAEAEKNEELTSDIQELREENRRLKEELKRANDTIETAERNEGDLEFKIKEREKEGDEKDKKIKELEKQLSVAKERGRVEAERDYAGFRLRTLEKEMKQFIKDRIDDEGEEGVDRVISQSELDLRDRLIEEQRNIIFELTNFTLEGEALAVNEGSITDTEQFKIFTTNKNMVKLMKALFNKKIAEKFKRLAEEPNVFYEFSSTRGKGATIEDIIRGYDKTDFADYNFEELKNEMRVSLGEFTPEELYTRDTNRRLQMELENLELVLLFGTTSYREIKDMPEVKFSNKASYGGKQKLDPDYGKPYVDDIVRKYKNIDKKIVEIAENEVGSKRDLRVITEDEYRGLVAGEEREVEREERVIEDRSEEVAKLKAENDRLERQLDEARDEADDFARNALELEEKVKELEEAVDEGDRGNAYDILETILETLGVDVESVLDEVNSMGLDDFIGSEKYTEMIIEPIERGLFS